jgi:hypothetical protein
VSQTLEVLLDLGNEGHAKSRAPYVESLAHACELGRKFAKLCWGGFEEEAHVVVDEGELSGERHIVLELEVDCALMLDETLEVSLEEVLGKGEVQSCRPTDAPSYYKQCSESRLQFFPNSSNSTTTLPSKKAISSASSKPATSSSAQAHALPRP